MAPSQYTGPRMPRDMNALINATSGGQKNKHTQSRTEKRKFERQQKKSARAQPRSNGFKTNGRPAVATRPAAVPKPKPSPKPPAKTKIEPVEEEDDEVSELEDEDDESLEEDGEGQSLDDDEDVSDRLDESAESEAESEAPAPSTKLSRTVRDRLAKDDEDIAALERKLGIKKKKGKKDDIFDDGLEDLFGPLSESDAETPGAKPKRKLAEDEEWLRQKRRKVQAVEAETAFDGFSDEDGEDEEDEDMLEDDDEDEDEDEDEDGEEPPADESLPVKKRENPYVAPVAANDVPAATGKYIPPSLRKAAGSADETVIRLNRKIQGLINRLSEANLLSIVQSVEALYQDNARQHVTSSIIDCLLSLVGESATLSDLFIVLHGAFIAALYRLMGTDFGAQLLERIVALLDDPSGASSKKPVNLVSLLSIMYSLQVISCDIIYDLMRQYIKRFTEDDTELLLRVVRLCGPQLRQDDQAALKDVVSMVQAAAAEKPSGTLSVRQSFMIEIINDLKNNRLKGNMASSATRNESLGRMKKLLGTVKSKSSKASEPLRLSLDDIRSSDKKGKWWLVGASWHDPAKMASADEPTNKRNESKSDSANGPAGDANEVDLVDLARRQGMNTDIRRSIFLAIMSAIDYKHAVVQVHKLNLKKAQMEEIPLVLARCILAEKTFNPYYALVGRELCQHRQVAMAFQFVLWDYCKRMDPLDDEDDIAEEEQLDIDQIIRLAMFYAKLIRSEALSVTILKKMDFMHLQAKTNLFLQILLTNVILDKTKSPGGSSREHILAAVDAVPDMVPGYKYFLQHAVAVSQVPEKTKDRKKVAELCDKVVDMLGKPASRVVESPEYD